MPQSQLPTQTSNADSNNFRPHTHTHTQEPLSVAFFIFYDTPNLCPARFGGIAPGRTPIYVLFGPVLCQRPDPLLCLPDGVHRPECGDSIPA